MLLVVPTVCWEWLIFSIMNEAQDVSAAYKG